MYWSIALLERAKINNNILVPCFLCEVEYNSNVELLEVLEKTFKKYIDIRYTDINHLGYKHIFICNYIDDDDTIKYDLIGANIIAYE